MKKYFFTCLLAAVYLNAIGQESAPFSGSQPKSFNTSPDNLGFLQNSVNLFSGQVQFGLPVATISGKSGLSYSLVFSYSSKVKYQAETWNREAPTGVLGLGWGIDLPRIVANNKGTGNREDDTFYLIEGGSSNELVYTGLVGSEWNFYLTGYQFWSVRYNPATEKWTIIKDDGNKYIYGDINSQRYTIQYNIKWGNWIGDSKLTTGQQQQANTWNLSEIVDLWNDNLTFEYLRDDESMGGSLTHTKASYLKEIRNAVGERITLSYLTKFYGNLIPGTSSIAIEYQDLHTEGAEPDGYQEKYEVRYLDKVTVYASNSQIAERHSLSYDFLGSGELAKRLLKSVQKASSSGALFPAMTFAYEKNTSKNMGALVQITLPAKGTVDFNYEEQVLPGTERQIPIPAAGNYYEPRFWFGEDYAVVSRRAVPAGNINSHSNAPQPVILDVFTWENGKWSQKNLGPDYWTTGTLKGVVVEPIADGANLKEQKFECVTGKDFFATMTRRGDISLPIAFGKHYGRYDLDIFRRNKNKPGEWDHYHEEFSDVFYYNTTGESNTPKLLAGDDFILIGGDRTLFKVYEWTGTTWSSWTQSITGSEFDHYYEAGHNYFIVHDENRTSTDVIKFYYKNKANQWQNTTVPSSLSFNSEYSGVSYWHASNTSAVVMANDNTEFIYTWDENFNNFQRFNTTVSINDASPVSINGGMVAMSQYINDEATDVYAFRYNGQSWVPSVKLTGPSYSLGNDFIYNKGYYKSYNANVSAWNVNKAINNCCLKNVISGYNYFIDDSFVYNINPNGSLTSSGQILSSSSLGAISGGLDFVVERNVLSGPRDAVIFHSFKNGKPLPSDALSTDLDGFDVGYTWSEKINGYVSTEWDRHVPSNQTGSNSFITYIIKDVDNATSSYWLQNSGNFNLYRKVGDKARGPLSDFIITRVTTSDGSTSRYTSYQYDLATATTDFTGLNFQFNKVTTVSGSKYADVKPYGSTETFFFNGKPSSSLSAEAAFPSMTNVSAVVSNTAAYLNKFTGLPYKVVQKNSTGGTSGVVSETLTDYYVYQANQNTPKVAYYLRPWYNTVTDKANGMKMQTYNVYDATTRQLKSEQTTTLDASGNAVQTITNDITYWWEAYDASRVRNLLSPVVRKETSLNGIITGISSTRWNSSGIPYPVDNFAWTGPSETGWSWDKNIQPSANWQFVSKVSMRDATTGIPLEEVSIGDRVNSTIWDANKRLPLATIKNASVSDVAYTGFEDTSKGNLVWSDGAILSGDSKTGSKYFTLGTVGLTKSGLSPSKTYKISFWVKSNGGTIAIDGLPGTISIGSVSDWALMTYEIKGVSQICVRKTGTIDVLVDDIRIHPSSALMATKTFHPVQGLISETDANNRTIYYEYDSFDKLKIIKDDDKNIIKHVFNTIKD